MIKNNKGFTLIELLLVVVIIGLMLAVIVPRAWRANIDAKYGLVRQNCSELASFAQEWAQGQQAAQDESDSTATTDTYFGTLTGETSFTHGGRMWIADLTEDNNWTNSGGQAPIAPVGRRMPGTSGDVTPEATVEEIIPPEKVLRNPFNQSNVFQSGNDPTDSGVPIPGAIALASRRESNSVLTSAHCYAFLFQGTDSTSTSVDDSNGDAFYAGQSAYNIEGLRNGVFMARL